jgi:myotubularin-related protein 6/7/8
VVTELDLKLVIKTQEEEKVVKPTYTGASAASLSVRLDLAPGETFQVALRSLNEVIGVTTVDLREICRENPEDDRILYDLQMFTNSWKMNSVFISLEIIKTNERPEYVSRRSFIHQKQNLIEKYLFTSRVSIIFNDVQITGNLHLTSHYFFISSESNFNENWLKVWVQSIRSVKLNPKSLTILTKDLRQIEVISEKVKEFNDVLTNLLSITVEKAVEFFHSMTKNLPSNDFDFPGCVLFEAFQRFASPSFILSYLNLDYRLCESYPCLLYFPSNINDSVLRKTAEFRSKGRLPTVTWCRENVALYRSSQPKLGLGKRSQDDENFFKSAKIKYVIDARPGMNAKANRLKGKGYEREVEYDIKLKFMNIQNIHHVTRSFEALVGLGRKRDGFWQALSDSKWMSHIILILEAAICCVNHLVIEKASLLVHCSDGWDRTSQICALTQIIIDPFFRTFVGFQQVVNKDWFAFGHKFFDRTFGGDYSPIFLLFLDCVHQVMDQFPLEFEFNHEFLIYLADASIQGTFGEFLANNERERLDLIMRTQSVWRSFREDWKNQRFSVGLQEVLNVSTSPFKLKVWMFFTRFT